MKIGNSIGLIFTKSEAEIYEISVGDIIDIEDIVVVKPRRVTGKDTRERKK